MYILLAQILTILFPYGTGDALSPIECESHSFETVMGAFAEFERSLIKERQKEGIALAKSRGVYTGRKPTLSAERIAELKERVRLGIPKARVARDFKITRETVYQYLRNS